MIARQGPLRSLSAARLVMYRNPQCTGKRSTAVLFGPVMVVNIYAPDSAKSLEEYERFMQVLMKVITEG